MADKEDRVALFVYECLCCTDARGTKIVVFCKFPYLSHLALSMTGSYWHCVASLLVYYSVIVLGVLFWAFSAIMIVMRIDVISFVALEC
jgi:hypothetical protein